MSFSRPGAVDLSGLAGSAAEVTSTGGRWSFDVTDKNFQADVLQASMRYIVVLHLWSPRSPQSQAFNDVLGRVTDGYDGRLVLARVDVDANPGLSRAFNIMSIPTIAFFAPGKQPMGVVGFRPMEQLETQFNLASFPKVEAAAAAATADADAASASDAA